MHFSMLALSAAAVSAVNAQQMSICDKYTMALLKDNSAKNQYTLLTLLVNTAGIGNFTGPGTTHPELPGSMVNVPGILAPGMVEGEAVNLMPYFSGALKSTNRNDMPTSVNFLDGGGAQPIIANPASAGAPGSNQYKLFTHLYSFFGKLLGCSHYGEMDFPVYSGAASQYNVHKYMDLDHAQNTWFIQQVGLAAKSFGASDSDIQMVATSLNNAFNYRCSPSTELITGQGAQLQSICQNATCPLDPKNTCAAYPSNGAVMAPAPAMMSGSSGAATASPMTSGMATTMGASAVSQISDKQPQAATTAGVVSQISDHQPQAATSAAVTQISDHQPQAATTAAAVSQISDHQPQAATSAAITQISDHQPQAPTTAGTPVMTPTKYTGAAVANAAAPVLGGLAGLVAMML